MAPIWKPLGQGRTLALSMSIFDPLGAPWPPYTNLRCPLKQPDFQNVIEASSVAPIWKSLGQGKILVPPRPIFYPLGTLLAPVNYLKISP